MFLLAFTLPHPRKYHRHRKCTICSIDSAMNSFSFGKHEMFVVHHPVYIHVWRISSRYSGMQLCTPHNVSIVRTGTTFTLWSVNHPKHNKLNAKNELLPAWIKCWNHATLSATMQQSKFNSSSNNFFFFWRVASTEAEFVVWATQYYYCTHILFDHSINFLPE